MEGTAVLTTGNTRLPIELLRIIFEYASDQNAALGATLCRVCHTACSWTRPLLYDTVSLDSSEKIEKFAQGLTGAQPLKVSETPVALLVHRLWIGPTSSIEPEDLDSTSDAWPTSQIYQILTRCRDLQWLAVICILQFRWATIVGAIPPSVSDLCLGPAHGKVWFEHLPCFPSLRHFTAINMNMYSEMRMLLSAPAIRTIRRVWSQNDLAQHPFNGIPASELATSAVEEVEVVYYGETEEEARRWLESRMRGYEYDRARVVLVPEVCVKRDRRWDLLASVYKSWVEEGCD